MRITLLSLSIVTLVSLGAFVQPCNTVTDKCCDLLETAGVEVFRPGTAAYEEREESYFSVSAQLGPSCIARPASAEGVSQSVRVLRRTGCKWAIRGGGHMTWRGASNIRKGVTIDMGKMNDITYSPKAEIVSIGAGARWSEVYSALEPYGVTAPGARTASVGVAGYLLAGGNNFFSAEVGLGCDNVANFEIVLADGRIVDANHQLHKDLFKALKGGSNNFGIVTRIDMQTVKVARLWGGQAVYPESTAGQHIAALIKWTNNIPSYTQGSAVIFRAYSPDAGTVISTAFHDASDTEWAPAYDDFRNIRPQLSNTLRHDSHLNMTLELEEPEGYIQVWFTLTGKNDPCFIQRAFEEQANFVNSWKATQGPNFHCYITIQALSRSIFKHSVNKGGNVVGLEDEKGPALLFQMQMMIRPNGNERLARQLLRAMHQRLVSYYHSKGILINWSYQGYADSTQSPLSTIGKGNIEFIKQVAEKYDRDGVFQERVSGGFKIPHTT
ncbi:related to 6-hydroxy-d-nicotine oxidase [Fusarium torulosum]|uniref:Related to 6-hydroxy-d-nicotine oxidase n=1 Tax=Fusarium torulosum TaxID=33205 RepID=A0AAE8MEN6_9HYPO|nr:related to 6-hydroxy-d-nicotine oxidase [Fusarium torulosum]